VTAAQRAVLAGSLFVSGLTLVAAVFFQRDAAAATARTPDVSGFWSPLRSQIDPDPVLRKFVPEGTAVMRDTGAAEFGLMEFGGLKLRPAALAAARSWDPRQDMTVANACRIPSIAYALQGPFPMEIFQGRDLLVMRLEYFDMARVFLLDGSAPWPADAPHTKTGFSLARWRGEVLEVVTTHLSAATLTNNGLDHSNNIKITERYRLADNGKQLIASQEYDDPTVLENRGVRYMAWQRVAGDHVHAYDCDPSYAENYATDVLPEK
jgi:hypothetical protein